MIFFILNNCSWTAFWQKKQGVFDDMMYHYTYFTAKKLHEKQFILPSDEVLDIGCGQGRMADFFSGKTKKWVGLDISENYIGNCKNRFRKNKDISNKNPTENLPENSMTNFEFYTIPSDDYLNFEVLKSQKFDKIVVMSVVQYFKNTQEIETLILNAQKYLKPNGKIIIADIVMTENTLKSVWNIFGASVRHGFLFTFLRFILHTRFSNYYKLRQENHLLTIPKDILDDIIKRNNLKAQILGNLTMDSERKTLVIDF